MPTRMYALQPSEPKRGGEPLSATNVKRGRRVGISSVVYENLTTEILLRLPVRSLLRFRGVCKHWLSIIQDPQFTQSHVHLSQSRLPSIIFLPLHRPGLACIARLDTNNPLSSSDIDPLFLKLKRRRIHVDGSCNGLIAVAGVDARTQVVNPLTGQSITVPQRTMSQPSNCIPPFVSMGYHPVTMEYKLVSFFGVRDVAYDQWIRCEVYTLGTSSWREIAMHDDVPVRNRVVVSAKGFMYWRLYQRGGFSLLRFDLRDEVFIRTPTFLLDQFYQQWDRYHITSDLINLGGSICLPVLLRSEMREIRQMDLWMLNEDDYSWTRKYSIAFPLGESSSTYSATPLLIHKDKVLLHHVITPGKNQHTTCNLQFHHLWRCDQEQVKDTIRSCEEVGAFDSFDFFPIIHVESLISLPKVQTQNSGTEARPSRDLLPTIRTL